MTSEEIATVESQLNVRLPADFREALLARGSEEEYSPFAAAALIQRNQQSRQSGILNYANDARWPEHFICLGSDFSGDGTWFIRTDMDPSGVWTTEHHRIDGVKKIADDVAGFMKSMPF
jgi:hypothetical protein